MPSLTSFALFLFLAVCSVFVYGAVPSEMDPTVGGDVQIYYQGQVKPVGFKERTCIPYVRESKTAMTIVARAGTVCFYHTDAVCQSKETRLKKPFEVKLKKVPISPPPNTSPQAIMCYLVTVGPEQ